MLVYPLIAAMFVLLFFSYMFMKKDLASPPVMFVGPFLVALLCAAVYQDKWDLNMHFNTFSVLLCGCLVFVFCCFAVHYSIGNNIRKKGIRLHRKKAQEINYKDQRIEVEAWKILFFILLQIISLFVVIRSMRNTLAPYGVGGSLTIIMYYYREYHMFSDYNVQISGLASNLRLFSIAGTYIWIYIICNNFVLKKKKNNIILMISSIVCGIANCVILGARGEAIQLIVAAIVIYLFLQRKYNNWRPNIKFYQIVLVGIVLMAIMIGFKSSGNLLGRQAVVTYSTSAIDEVAKYLGAEIKNLDLYLQSYTKVDQVWGSQTFGNLLSWINSKLDLGWKIKSVLPFNKVNGISLGNVYTCFYAYIYDFGYLGVMWVTAITAVCSQLFYEYAVVEKGEVVINFGVIVNSYILFLIAFSFFGERFFANVLCIAFVKYLIIWKIFIWFVTTFRIRKGKIRIK